MLLDDVPNTSWVKAEVPSFSFPQHRTMSMMAGR